MITVMLQNDVWIGIISSDDACDDGASGNIIEEVSRQTAPATAI